MKTFAFLQLSRDSLFDLFSKVLKSPTLLLVMAGNVPAPMAVYITYTYLPTVGKQNIWQTSVSDLGHSLKKSEYMSNLQMAQSLGFSLAHASLLISVVGVTNTLGRIFSGWITDLPNFR